jgi:hypothetical protein
VKSTLKRGLKALEIVKREPYTTVDWGYPVRIWIEVQLSLRTFTGCKEGQWAEKRVLLRLVTYQHRFSASEKCSQKVLWGRKLLESYRWLLPMVCRIEVKRARRSHSRGAARIAGSMLSRVEVGVICASSGIGYLPQRNPHSMLLMMLAKRFCATRLEIWIKESNMYVSF